MALVAGATVLGGMLGLATGTVASASVTSGITVAGGNGEASAADQLFEPSAVFVDGAGNVYVADTNNNRVQEWFPGATSGVTVAGGNGQGSAANQLSAPEGVFVDSKGDVYVADGNSRVQEWAPGATSGVTVAGGNGDGSAANQVTSPTGLFVDGVGDVYVADSVNDRVQEWAPGATSGVTVAGGNGQGSAANQLFDPSGVFVDGAGNVYVADANNNRVQEWAPGATSGVTVAGDSAGFPGGGPNQLTLTGSFCSVYVDGAGDLYVADNGNNRVQEFAPGATSGLTVAGGNGVGTAANEVTSPTGLFVDGSGDVYVASLGDEVQEWKPGPNGAPLTTIDPQSQSVITGANVTFTAGAIAEPFPTMQWQESTDGGATWSDIAGATSIDYSLTSVPLSDNDDEFRAVFTNGAGSDPTDPATLTVNTASVPTITTQPVSVSVPVNAIATFTAAASGEPPPGIQWQESTDGGTTWSDLSPQAGGTSNSIDLGSVPLSDNGEEFQAVFANGVGTATTNVAVLTVTQPPLTTSVLVPTTNDVTVSGTSLVLDASVSSPVGITSVSFEINPGLPTSQVIATATPTLYGWLAEWNTTTVPNDDFDLQSVATDADGNTAFSAPILIMVRNPWAIVLPANNATISGNAYLDSTVPSGATKVVYEVSGGPLDLSDAPVATGTLTYYGWLAQWNTTTVPNGTYMMQSVATYSDGLTGTNDVNNGEPLPTVVVDNPPPTTSVLIPSSGASVSGASSLLDASASVSAGVMSVSFELSGGTLSDQVIATGTATLYGWLAEWNTTTVPDGTYTLQSVATYAGGVSGTSSPITITVSN